MKILPVALLTSLLGVASGFAGSFGPPPFSNGSPLQSGTDGTYQASMYGTNVSGIIRFAYTGGSQTGGSLANNWVAFVDGQILRGTPDTVIGGDGSITGVLDSSSSAANSNDGTVTLPLIFIVSGSSSAGNFNAKLDFKSPFGSFSGKGSLQGATAASQTLYIITTNLFGDPIITNASFTNVGGSLPQTDFKVLGMRTSTTVTSAGTNSSSTNSQ